jgi:hypothetical protein
MAHIMGDLRHRANLLPSLSSAGHFRQNLGAETVFNKGRNVADRGGIIHAAAICDIWPAIPPAPPCPSAYPQHVEEALAGSGARIDRCSVAFKVAPRARLARDVPQLAANAARQTV